MEEIWQIEMFLVEGKQGRLRSGAGGMVINQTYITTSNNCSKFPFFICFWKLDNSFSDMPFDLLWLQKTVGAFPLFLTRLWCPIAAPLVVYKNISDSPSNWDITLLQEPYLTSFTIFSFSSYTFTHVIARKIILIAQYKGTCVIYLCLSRF